MFTEVKNVPMLSVVVITLNEQERIRDCLESVKWADEIIVVDSCSQDRTVEIAKEYTYKVYQHEFLGDGPMRNFSIGQACGEWILTIDADERISPELRTEIQELLKSPKHDGYYIPFKVFFLGKWMKHGGFWPEYHLRLFRKDRGRFSEVPAHAKAVIKGKIGKLKNHIIHFTCDNLSNYVAKLNSHTNLIARQKNRGSSVLKAFLHAWARFLNTYLIKAGFLDGKEGFIVSALLSYYVLIKHLKLWEKKKRR